MTKLSRRLRSIYNMVTPGSVVCDIGCDHGFLSIALVEDGISPRAIAMDLRPGPLSRAGEHIEEAGLSEKIELRLSDGAKELSGGEADTVIIAGMGGNVMMHILTEGRDVLSGVREMILEPQSEIRALRQFLSDNGYELLAEDMVEEDGKYYPLMKVTLSLPDGKGDTRVFKTETDFLYGPLLIKNRHPVLHSYLCRELRIKKDILSSLPERNEERIAEVRNSIRIIDELLEIW